MKINLYRGFAADQRLSMHIYADQLAACFSDIGLSTHLVSAQSSLERHSSNRWLMRYLRYRQFPRRVAHQTADIHHVVDHGYAHLRPRFKTGRTCITVHDLIPLLASRGLLEGAGMGHRPWLNQYSLSFVSKYDRVVAPSVSTSRDLQEHLGIAPELIDVIPPIIGTHFRPLRSEQITAFAERYQLRQDCDWVMISGQEAYKNHETSLKAIRRLRETGHNVRLLKTGVRTPVFDSLVDEFDLRDAVTQIYLHNAVDLVEVYNFVDCLLFPSWYEGFGMPVVEALACGTPVVTSNRGSLAEIGEGVVNRAEPHDVDAITHQLSLALGQAEQPHLFLTPALAAVEQYRPAAVAAQWQNLIKSLLA